MKICVIVPPERDELIAVARLRARADLDVQVITYGDPPEVRQARKLGQLTPELAELCPPLGFEDEQVLASAQVVIARDLPLDLATRAPSLRWVQAVGAGIEQLDPPGLASIGITLTNASGVAAAPIAEYVLAHFLAVWKRIRLFDEQQQAREWKRQETALVIGKTLGIIGLGAIGRATAVRARAFGIRVLATSRRSASGTDDDDADLLFSPERVDEMLSQSDAVLASMPATPATFGYFDAERFAAFKEGSVFCNISRGSIVDEAALLAALKENRPATAVLDVTAVEPNPGNSPLWHHPQIHLTPHSSTSMEGYGDRLLDLFLDNVARWQRGDSLRNVVDPELAY